MILGIVNNYELNIIKDLLESVYSKTFKSLKIIDYHELKPNYLDLIIINEYQPKKILDTYISSLKQGGIILFNSNCEKISQFSNPASVPVINYGFNSKSCLTASSVTSENFQKIQCCLQRELPTIKGNSLCQQEFPVNMIKPCENISTVLAVVATALVDNVEIGQINFF